MPAPNLGSILVGSSQVDAMKDWYRACFGPGTVADPDGNMVQIIEWGATPDEGHG